MCLPGHSVGHYGKQDGCLGQLMVFSFRVLEFHLDERMRDKCFNKVFILHKLTHLLVWR